MPSGPSLLEREMRRVELRPFTLEGFHRQRERKERNRRIRAGVVALIVAAAGTGLFVRAFSSPTIPAGDPPVSDVLRAHGEVLDFTGDPFQRAPGDLVAVNPETGEERVLVEDLEVVYSARWSADGRWVAYEGSGPQGIGLWVVSASHEPRQVATDATWVWSTTGADLVTIRGKPLRSPDYSGATLRTIDPATGGTTDFGSISEDVGDVTSVPAWSPDGTRFVFGARGGTLYSFDALSGARVLVRLPGGYLDSVDRILWSPDGARIAVMNDLSAERGGGRLYVMDADGSNVRVLTDEFDPMGVAWSPDGTRLAYVDGSGNNGAVWVATMDGSAPTEIGSPPAVYCGDLFCEDDLTWSPDGSRIAFRSAGGDSVDVAAIDADGQGDAGPIDDLTFRSWDGGWYSCGCP